MGKLESLARERIIRWRKENGISQERLGQITGTHQTTVGKWEKGGASMDIDTLSAWARFFGRTLFDLVAQEDLSDAPDTEFLSAYNSASDELKASILGVLKSVRRPDTASGGRRGSKLASKRGTG